MSPLGQGTFNIAVSTIFWLHVESKDIIVKSRTKDFISFYEFLFLGLPYPVQRDVAVDSRDARHQRFIRCVSCYRDVRKHQL